MTINEAIDDEFSDESIALIEPQRSCGARRAICGKIMQYFAVMVTVVVVVTISDILKKSWMVQKFSNDASSPPFPSPQSSLTYSPVKGKNDYSSIGEILSEKDNKESDGWKYSATVQIREEDASLSIEQYVIKYMSKDKSPTQTAALMRNLEFVYTDVREMLSRPLRFPSVEQRLKIYMSNWYIPPCDDDGRVIYAFATDSCPELLNVTEISLQPHLSESIFETKQKYLQEQRMFLVNSRFYLPDTGIEEDTFDRVHFLDREFFLECRNWFCRDMVENLLPSFDRALANRSGLVFEESEASNIPILFQAGDSSRTASAEVLSNGTVLKRIWYPRMPVIQKARRRISPSLLKSITDDVQYQCYEHDERRAAVDDDDSLVPNIGNYESVHMEPIIIKLNSKRHYGKILEVAEADVIPWEGKRNQAVFRGALTGLYPFEMKSDDIAKLTVVERCRLLERCWLVYSHASSKIVDAKITEPYDESRMRMIPLTITPEPGNVHFIGNEPSVDLRGDSLTMNELLEYKALIMLEGNDISSGLKWALFSNSIVLMPEPSLTSWSMEEMLIPWVHYVPINVMKDRNGDTYTDIEEKMQWIMRNDEKAKEIVKAGKLWIADLVLHPNVHKDELEIYDDIARRYLAHFTPLPRIV